MILNIDLVAAIVKCEKWKARKVVSDTYAHYESVETNHHSRSKRTRTNQRCKCVRVSGVWNQPGDPKVRRI